MSVGAGKSKIASPCHVSTRGCLEALGLPHISLSLPVCPSPWLTWASSPYGRLRVARLLTWRFKPRRTCVPRGPGRRIFMTSPWKSQKISHRPKHSSRGAVPLGTTFKKEFVIQLGAVTPIAASHCSTFWSHCSIPAQGTSSQ